MYTYFHIAHLVFVFLLTGVTFSIFANPAPERRKRLLILGHGSALLVLVTGFGLLGVMKLGVPGWSIVKLICWLVLTGASGMAFRKKDMISTLSLAAAAAIFIAILMVDLRPF